MPGIDVCICAEGNLPEEEARELEDLGMSSHVDHVVLDGTVVDQAALLGVLERLRRAGLTIREVGPTGRHPDRVRHARLSVVGHVAELLSGSLEDAVMVEEPATTTVEIGLAGDDEVFELLRRVESLGLDIRSLHIGPSLDGSGSADHIHLG